MPSDFEADLMLQIQTLQTLLEAEFSHVKEMSAGKHKLDRGTNNASDCIAEQIKKVLKALHLIITGDKGFVDNSDVVKWYYYRARQKFASGYLEESMGIIGLLRRELEDYFSKLVFSKHSNFLAGVLAQLTKHQLFLDSKFWFGQLSQARLTTEVRQLIANALLADAALYKNQTKVREIRMASLKYGVVLPENEVEDVDLMSDIALLVKRGVFAFEDICSDEDKQLVKRCKV